MDSSGQVRSTLELARRLPRGLFFRNIGEVDRDAAMSATNRSGEQ